MLLNFYIFSFVCKAAIHIIKGKLQFYWIITRKFYEYNIKALGPCFFSKQDRYPWLCSLSVSAEIATGDIICNITLNGITLKDSTWTLNGFNLDINNISFTETNFLLKSPEKENETYTVIISSSSLGQIKISKGFQISIFNCSVEGNLKLTSTLILWIALWTLKCLHFSVK